MGLIVVLVFAASQHESSNRCLDRQADRQVLRATVTQAYSSTSASLDLTKVPGFDELDPKTQAFIANIGKGASSTPPTSRNATRDQLLAQIPPIGCT